MNGGLLMFITTGKAAKICGVRVNTIKNWIQNGSLQAIQTPGGHWRIPRDAFLEFADRHSIPLPQSMMDQAATQEQKRILIVDDDPAVHELIVGALDLSPFHYETLSAYDGCSGLMQVGLFRPHVLILDIMMPEINGLEVIHRLKLQNESLGGMKILAITAATDRFLVMKKLKEAGPDAILSKPLKLDILVDTVERLFLPADDECRELAGSGI
jgi:excisionase family DNA binding protein